MPIYTYEDNNLYKKIVIFRMKEKSSDLTMEIRKVKKQHRRRRRSNVISYTLDDENSNVRTIHKRKRIRTAMATAIDDLLIDLML